MNKSKNTMSLKNLAMSLKKSIDLDARKSNKTPLTICRSTVNLSPYNLRPKK